MATATKHMLRSHRSYNNVKPFGDFERKARVAKYAKEARKETKGFLNALLHRTTNK